MSQFRIDSRPKNLSALMVLPVALAVSLLIFAGLTVFLIWKGGTAEGESLEVSISGVCLDSAQPIVEARMEAIGLGNPRSSRSQKQLLLSFQLPGRAENEKHHIPQLLTQPGKLLLRFNQTIYATEKDLKKAIFQTDEEGMPYVGLILTDEKYQPMQEFVLKNPKDHLVILIDGEQVAQRPNSKKLLEEEMRLYPLGQDTRERMKKAVDIAILLANKPIACELTLERVHSAL